MIEGLIVSIIRAITRARPLWQGSQPSATQRIYVANHTSHLDFLVLTSVLPPALRCKTRPVAAADYWNRGPLRRYLILKVFRGVLLNRDRWSLNPLAPVHEALRHGDSLIFFPEGTRGPGPSLQPLKSGIAHLARSHRHIDLIPVWIGNNFRTLTFGAPLRWQHEQNHDQFLEQLKQALESLCPR